jgi:glucan-binding YG repeat protein
MKTGLQKIGKYYYYFYTRDKEYKDAPVGAMLYHRTPGTAVEIDNKLHLFNPDGQAYSGWIDWSDWYYFYESGVPAYGLKTINNKKYLFVDSHSNTVKIYTQTNRSVGFLAKNQWVIINDKYKYYANEKGIVVTGWQTIDGETYYFNTDGKLVSGWKQINNKWYFFRNNKVSDTKSELYDDRYGEMLKANLYQINKKWYSFNGNGVMQYGWKKFGKDYYYFDKTSGAALTGWQTLPINNTSTTKAIYYFEPSANWRPIMYTGLKTINGKKYYFGKTYGKLTYGWQQIDGKWYYFDKANKGAAVVNTSKKIGNKTYKFNKNGVCTNK